jgi:hypothetical protein
MHSSARRLGAALGVAFVVATNAIGQPAGGGATSPHPELRHRIETLLAEPPTLARDDHVYDLWKYIEAGLKVPYSNAEIDEIADLLGNDDPVIVHGAAVSLANIGVPARRAEPAFQSSLLKWRCLLHAHPTPSQLQTPPHTLELSMLQLGIKPKPMVCEAPNVNSPHPELHGLIAAIDAEPSSRDRDYHAFQLWLYVKEGLNMQYAGAEIDDIAALMTDRDASVAGWAVFSLAAIGPDSRRAAPVFQKVLADQTCRPQSPVVPEAGRTLRDTVRGAMELLKIEPQPVVCALQH